MAPGKRIHRFHGRTLSGAARRAIAELGDDVVIVDVRTVRDDRGVSRTELIVSAMDKVGIPSLVDFLRPANPQGTSAPPDQRSGSDAEHWPARYERVWRTLVHAGMREDQATVLVRRAWADDEELEALPWESVRRILEHDAACSPPLDLSRLQILGVIGLPFTGRSTVSGGICRMASEIIPDRVALLTPKAPEMPGDEVEVFGYEGPEDGALSISRLPDVRLVVIDLPAPSFGEPRLGLAAWWRMFPELTLLPVVDAMGPTSEAVNLISACSNVPHTGWVMTGVDDDGQLGQVLSLSMATHGPLGTQGKEPDDIPRLQLARWDDLVHRLSASGEMGPEETGESLAASGGGGSI